MAAQPLITIVPEGKKPGESSVTSAFSYQNPEFLEAIGKLVHLHGREEVAEIRFYDTHVQVGIGYKPEGEKS